MNWGGPEFVLGIIAIGTIGSIARHKISAVHGIPFGRRARRHSLAQDSDEAGKLRIENAELKAHLAKIEDRTRVLERIVTDGSYGVAQQIKALRDPVVPRVETDKREPA